MYGTRRRLTWHLVIAALACAALPASAAAMDVAPGWVVETYATGFDSFGGNNDVGPIGVAFDGGGNLFVTVPRTDSLHKIPPGGGSAPNHVVRRGYGVPAGLAWDRDGRLYMARRNPGAGDVIEISPADGNHIRTIASDFPCAIGLATDPVSGDLFVSNNHCPGGGIFRLSNFADGPASVRRYAGTADADGLTFGPDGTLYAASEDEILRIDGTNTATPGRVSKLADVPHTDGIAVAPATDTQAGFLLVARTDGNISRVDFDGTVTDVVTNGSRGDLVTVGPDRCMYVTVSNEILKVGPSNGPCAFAQPAEPDGSGVLGVRFDSQRRVTDLSVRTLAPKRIRRGRRFAVRLRARNNGPRNASAVVVSYTIPKGASLVRARGSKGVRCKRRSKRSRVVQCRRSSLAVRGAFTARLLLRSHTGRRYSNVARISARNLDNVLRNNRSRAITRVIAPS